MSDRVTVLLEPLGRSLSVKRGAELKDILYEYGVEFACGGKGRCKSCRVRVLEGELEADERMARLLAPEELKGGWRLACMCRVSGPVTLEVAAYRAVILSDQRPLDFVPGDGFGIAIDLGTTTLVGQLLDLGSGKTLAVTTALNPQTAQGGDVMSRVQLALSAEGSGKLRSSIRGKLGELVAELVGTGGIEPNRLKSVVLVGNTVMHHLFGGIDIHSLSRYPFQPEHLGSVEMKASGLGWSLPEAVDIRFLPCLGGFVGSDVLAGIAATGLYRRQAPGGLVDLGTNGEIVIGDRSGLLCASTAAGPAFEGGRISMGMRAATGAIDSVTNEGGRLFCHVLGDAEPRGICGSGLVDAVAAGLGLGAIEPSGRLARGEKKLRLAGPVELTQGDIRELQLSKAAIAAGIEILLGRLGLDLGRIERVYLAGAFGNYVDVGSARSIGLFPFPAAMVEPAGNTALLGAKLLLLAGEDGERTIGEILGKTRHLSLAADPGFQETFVEQMGFPPPGDRSSADGGSTR
jgi:uncharacterized 2Fe-2S/4Fe-4S cluster protein (DUF4445 family)